MNMRKTLAIQTGLVLTCWFIAGALAVQASAADGSNEALEKGKELAFDRTMGNCLACHLIADGELPGNSGPPLLQMKLRYPNRDELRDQIWDATQKNPDSVMPPYGKHQILTEEELDLVVDYVHSL